MDEDTFSENENEEEFRKMEKNIDDFLSSIRESVSKNLDSQSGAPYSEVCDDLDSISSDDFQNENNHPSPGNDESGFMSHARTFDRTSSKNRHKNRRGWGQQKVKGQLVYKQRSTSPQEEQHSSRGRQCRFSHEDEYDQYRRQSSSRKNYPQSQVFPPREGECHWPVSPRQRNEESNQNRSLTSRGRTYQYERSPSPSAGDEYYEGPSPSAGDEYYEGPSPSAGDEYYEGPSPSGGDEYYEDPSPSAGEEYYEGSDNYQRDTLHSFGNHRYKRKKFSSEEIEEHSYDSFTCNENLSHASTSGSRLNEGDSIYHKIYADESDASTEYEHQDYDDYQDPSSAPYWNHEEDDAFMAEDEDEMSSAITACLERVIADNPEIAQKISTACLTLVNKSVDRNCDSDYEYEEGSDGSFMDQYESGRAASRRWRDSRSHSFSRSPGPSLPGPRESRHYRNRNEGYSQRIVVEYSHSPSPEPGHSSHDRVKEFRHSSNYDKRRPAAASSQTFRSKKRSHISHHKKYNEEDPRMSYSRSIKKIKKQCDEETDPIVRRALLALLEVHQRECEAYFKKPDAHPDYIKEYKMFLDKKSRSIVELGGDPNGYDFQKEWKKYWPTQIIRLFRESWDVKMLKCTSMLQKKGHISKTLQVSSKKHIVNQPFQKKQEASKCETESVNVEKKKKKSEKTKSPEHLELQGTATAVCKIKKEDMNTKILSILKLLSHIKHKFKGCEAAFDLFYQKVLNLKQNNSDLSGVLQGNQPLLQRIDTSLRKTLQDENLTVVQKVVIKETHERFKCLFEKSQEIKSHSLKNEDNTLGKDVNTCESSDIAGKVNETFVSSTITDEKQSVFREGKHQIPYHITDMHPSVVTSFRTEHVKVSTPCACMCCDTNHKVCRPRRTLTEISIQESSCTESYSLNKSSNKKQDEKNFTCKLNPISTEEDSAMTEPPPPGVTPPPPGVTPPPPGVTPPPSSVTPPPPGVTPPPPGVTPPPPGLTSPPIALPLGVTPLQTDNIISPNVTTLPSLVSPSSVTFPGSTTPHITSPHPATQSDLSRASVSLSITSQLPGVTQPPQSLNSIPSQSPATQSLHVSNMQVPRDAALEATQHPSTMSTSIVQNSKYVNDKDMSVPSTRKVQQPSKELLRSTIKDCFMSATPSSKERRVVDTSTADPETDSKTKESVSSVPSLPEDILKMFVVKLEDKSEIETSSESIAKMNSSGSKAESDAKPVAKKPIKITIPQFPKRKSVPAFNPTINDDQELL